jgi:hypothetical protein
MLRRLSSFRPTNLVKTSFSSAICAASLSQSQPNARTTAMIVRNPPSMEVFEALIHMTAVAIRNAEYKSRDHGFVVESALLRECFECNEDSFLQILICATCSPDSR